MTPINPFEDNSNPWSLNTNNTNGPRFGNAYDDDNRNAWTGDTNTPTRMPTPSDYRTESSKIEYPSENDNAWDRVATPIAVPGNAYQYSGTRLGVQESSSTSGGDNAYSKTETTSAELPAPAGGKPRPNQAQVEAALPPKWDDARMNPSKFRLLLRTLQFIAAIGHLGFAAGASPFSGEDIPLDSSACFYYLWAVAIVSMIWAFFHVSFWCYRRIAHGNKLNRVLMSGIDLLLGILWGIGSIVEITTYRCSPGGYNHWCDFYNVSIFWGMFSFALFIAAFGWDIVGACVGRRK